MQKGSGNSRKLNHKLKKKNPKNIILVSLLQSRLSLLQFTNVQCLQQKLFRPASIFLDIYYILIHISECSIILSHKENLHLYLNSIILQTCS